MGCVIFIGILVVLVATGAGVWTGWASYGLYDRNKDRVPKIEIPEIPPIPGFGTPQAATSDMRGAAAGVHGDRDKLHHMNDQDTGHAVVWKQMPPPGQMHMQLHKQDGSQAVKLSSAMVHWYTVHDDGQLLSTDTVHAWLGALQEQAGVRLDPNLHSHTYELLAYLRMVAPNLLEMVRRYKETGRLPEMSESEVEALSATLTVEHILNFSKAPDDMHMQILSRIHNVDQSHDADGAAAAPASDDVEDVALTPKARIERDFGVTLQVSQMSDPRKQFEEFLSRCELGTPSPYSWFPKICIPTVWHVLQYRDEAGYHAPGNAYWMDDKPALELLECANRNFERAGLPLVLQLGEYRANVSRWPYLDIGSLDDWQLCAEQAELCTNPLAERYNVDANQVLNIYTAGTATCEGCCPLCASGYVSHLGDAAGVESIPSQHLAMSWDRVDPSVDNSVRASNRGCGTLTHEIAHIFGGLYHTHTGNCSDSDLVSDTPPNLDGNTVEWRSELSQWCSELALSGSPSWTKLEQFDSCKGDAYIDNVFNFMSYNPSACRLMFSPGQVQRMVETMYAYRPQLLKNARCLNMD